MNFIKKIVDKRIDESVHAQFLKFSKGEFRNRALIEVKKSKNKYTIKTSAEFANGFVRMMAEKLGAEKTNVTGAIVSTTNLKDELKFKEVKQFQGVKKYLIDTEMSGLEIVKLLDKFPKNFFALTFKVGDDILKIKPKAPKAPKPGKNGEPPKIDFCSLKTTDANMGKSFIFEKDDFSKAIIIHTYFIERIEVPEELKNSDDFALIREKSKRIGKIVRMSDIDGEKSEKEFEFSA